MPAAPAGSSAGSGPGRSYRYRLAGGDGAGFPADYALANKVEHLLNVNLREDAIIGRLDNWLAKELAPHRLAGVVRDLADA